SGSKKRAKGKAPADREKPSTTGDAQQVPISPAAGSGFEFITFARPNFDLRAQLSEQDDFDSDDEDAVDAMDKQQEEEHKKYSDKPLTEFPGYKWAISKKGKALLGRYALQSMKCDQDSFGMYIYNDWNAYGEQEIVENMVSRHILDLSALLPV